MNLTKGWKICILKTILLGKEIEEDTKNGIISHVNGSEELVLLICPHYSKPSIGSTVIPIKIPMTFSQK